MSMPGYICNEALKHVKDGALIKKHTDAGHAKFREMRHIVVASKAPPLLSHTSDGCFSTA